MKRNSKLWHNTSLMIIGVVICVFIALIATPVRANTRTVHQDNKALAHEIAEMMRAEGHPETHPIIIACQDWWREEDAKESLCPEYTTMEQRAKYPVAAAVWQALREAGLSEVHAAAIIGNAMAESGGHTLDLNLYQRVDGYYGIWAMSLYYFPEVDGEGVPGQVAVLLKTLEPNMKSGGGDIDYWWSLTDVRAAAKFFSDYWERPAVWNSNRADNAEVAYRFFTGR